MRVGSELPQGVDVTDRGVSGEIAEQDIGEGGTAGEIPEKVAKSVNELTAFTGEGEGGETTEAIKHSLQVESRHFAVDDPAVGPAGLQLIFANEVCGGTAMEAAILVEVEFRASVEELGLQTTLAEDGGHPPGEQSGHPPGGLHAELLGE